MQMPCLIYGPCVVSVTPWQCVKSTNARITEYLLSAPRKTLVSRFLKVSWNLKRVTPIDGAKWVGVGKLAIFNQQVAVSQKWCKIRPRLLLITNRKSHKRFRFLPKSTTLDDLERPYCALCCTNYQCYGGYHKNVKADRPILRAARI